MDDDNDEKILSIDEILENDDVEYAVIPGFKDGTFIRIGSLSAGDLIEWTEANSTPSAQHTSGLRLIIKSLVDANGKRIGDSKHLNALRNKSHKATERIVKEILKLNGLRVPEGF